MYSVKKVFQFIFSGISGKKKLFLITSVIIFIMSGIFIAFTLTKMGISIAKNLIPIISNTKKKIAELKSSAKQIF